MYRKGPGPSNLSGLDENLDYTCPDMPVFWCNLLDQTSFLYIFEAEMYTRTQPTTLLQTFRELILYS